MFIDYLKSNILPNSSLVLAFSGGLDSTVLLHQLIAWKKLYPQTMLRVIHVNHQVSVNSNEWALHCISICNKWNITCQTLNIQIQKTNNQGFESEARKERYKALIINLNKGDILLTAHHLNDQCETILLALKRGSGPLGLASMPIKLDLGNENYLLRPFLFIPKYQLEKYAQIHKLSWIEDESNNNIKFDRNFLRKILSIILKRWPYFIKSVSRSAELCGEQEKLIDELLNAQLNNLISSEDGGLIFTTFSTMSTIRQQAILRRWIARHNCLMPSRIMLAKIINEVIFSKQDANPCLIIGNYTIRRFHQKIYLLLNNKSSVRNKILFWTNTNQILYLPSNLGYLQGILNNKSILRRPNNDEVVSIKFQHKGHVNLFGRCGKKKINLLWKELNIPTWQREFIPLIYYNDILISAPGLFITKDGKINDYDINGWEIFWIKNLQK